MIPQKFHPRGDHYWKMVDKDLCTHDGNNLTAVQELANKRHIVFLIVKMILQYSKVPSFTQLEKVLEKYVLVVSS